MSEIAKMSETEIFLPEENRLIDKSLSIREQIVDAYLKKGDLTDNRDVRVINEVLNSMDSLVLGKMDKRLKVNTQKDNSEIVEVMKEVILNVKNESKKCNTVVDPHVDFDLEESELVPGEDQIQYEELDLEDFDTIIEG